MDHFCMSRFFFKLLIIQSVSKLEKIFKPEMDHFCLNRFHFGCFRCFVLWYFVISYTFDCFSGSLAVKDRVPVQLPDAMRMVAGGDKSKLSKYNPDKYIWAPIGLPREKIEEYFKTIPEDKRPMKNSPGEVYWHQQLISQFPPQDFQLEQSHFVDQDHVKTYEEFTATRNEHCLDRGYVRDVLPENGTCHQCKAGIAKGSVVVVAPKCGETVYFHPGCFVCGTCNELLCELVYCVAPPTDENSGKWRYIAMVKQ